MWDNILKFLNDNKDALGWLFGSGVVLAVLGGLYRFIVWLIKENRLRRIRTDDSFPFKIIPPSSNVAKEILGGADDDPLADRNIPYQQRIQGRNTRRDLEELIEDHRWILIIGRTGLGKTREAVQLAQSLNNEGWTVLYLTRETWLDAPAKLPNNVPERKLLFFLDDLNKKCLSSKAEIRPDSRESLTLPIYEPFQTRLERTLEAFDTFCGKGEIRVIGNARNETVSEFDEPTEWDKLGWTKHSNLWERFKLFDLNEPDQKSEQQLLTDTAEKANILINSDELQILAKRNDGTFRNLVENLSYSRTEGYVLSSENFRDTLKGTWQKRYQKAIQNYSEAKHIYDAIEILQSIGIRINFAMVIQTTEIISEAKLLRRLKARARYSWVLKKLIKTENLLHPRDGQIESKGYRIDPEKYLPLLYKQVFIDFNKSRPKAREGPNLAMQLLLSSLIPKSALMPSEKLNRFEKFFCVLFGLQKPLNNVAVSYSIFGFSHLATSMLLKTIELKNANIFYKILDRKSLATSWNSLGNSYHNLNDDDAAIQAYQNAVKLDPKDALYLGNLGILYQINNKLDDAIKVFNASIKANPKYAYSILSLALCCQTLGNSLEAERLLHSVEPLIKNEREYIQACFYVAKGEIDSGLTLLEIGLDKKQTSRSWAQKDPNFENIRDNQRYRKLVGLE